MEAIAEPQRHQDEGLSSAQAEQLLAQYGPNSIPTSRPVSKLEILISQFKNPIIYIILGAAVVSLLMGEVKDFLIIMVVVIFDVVLGYVQEHQASATYQGLKSLMKPTAVVMRDGHRTQIDATTVVPGDVVLLGAGDKIPADGTILEAYSFSVNESIMTGESEAVVKSTDDRSFMGTTVLTGRAVMEVSSTGRSTELGKIASTITETPEGETPLQKRLEAFSKTLTQMVMALTAGLFVVGVVSGKPALEMVRIAIVLAVAAIPEGLLIAVTVILVLGMKRVLQRKGLVKRMLAVETLGSVTVICTDKTGTLTEGRMRVTRLEMSDEKMGMLTLALNNDLSDSLESSLWESFREKTGQDPEAVCREYPRLDEVPFSSETKRMLTLHHVDGQVIALAKGAPEVIIEMCGGTREEQAQRAAQAETWANDGLKVLGLAYLVLKVDKDLDVFKRGTLYSWAGMIGIEDPIRKEVPAAVALCQKAGIHVKMITGDHLGTAVKIAKLAGLEVRESNVIIGDELDRLDDAGLRERIHDLAVFARIRPHQKLRIVSELQALGEVVAMVGDGVNDAPALKKADIGVVVGDATEVAKETADLVLLDNNFSTIVAAVEEGRVVFQNIKKVVSYTLSNSFAEILLVFAAMMLGLPAPLAVAQILWVHLICDGPVDIVLGFEPKEDGIMEEKPRAVNDPILGRSGMLLIAAISSTAAAACLYMFMHYLNAHNDLVSARTFTFETLAVISLVYVFAYRSMRRSIFHAGHLTANKPLLVSVAVGFVLALSPAMIPSLRDALGLAPSTGEQWYLIFGISITLLLMVEIAKAIGMKYERQSQRAA